MSKISFAVSRLVNPPGASPVLTAEQVWKGYEIKVRKPQTFLPPVTGCDVVSDEGNKVVRSISFNNAPPVEERVELFPNAVIYFEIPSTGHRITNLVSYNADGELVLTFAFANGIPGGPPPGAPIPSVEEMNKMVGGLIERTIERMRELAVEGTIL